MRQQGYYSPFLNMGHQGTENFFAFHMGQQWAVLLKKRKSGMRWYHVVWSNVKCGVSWFEVVWSGVKWCEVWNEVLCEVVWSSIWGGVKFDVCEGRYEVWKKVVWSVVWCHVCMEGIILLLHHQVYVLMLCMYIYFILWVTSQCELHC
jgi:hypothetical protein